MTNEEVQKLALEIIDDMKAQNVTVVDVRKMTSITDTMIICSGRSARHVQSIADKLVEGMKHANYQPLGVEGRQGGEWVLVDLINVVVHVMLPTVRDFYNLEKLWEAVSEERHKA